MKKLTFIFILLLLALVGCDSKEKVVREELKESGMNKQEQDATIDVIKGENEKESIANSTTEQKEEKQALESYRITESAVPFGGDGFTDLQATNADVYYEDNKTLVSFMVEDKKRYYVSVLENGKWVQKDQPYTMFEQDGINWKMKKNYLYGTKLTRDVYDNLQVSKMTIYEDKFLKEGTSKELSNLEEYDFSHYKITNSNKGEVLIIGDFENYILPKEAVVKSLNIDHKKFDRGLGSRCYSTYIDFEANALYCNYPTAAESRISKFNIGENNWQYSGDGSNVKEAKLGDDNSKIVLNSEGVVGSLSLVDNNLYFQAFDKKLEPISEEFPIKNPVNDNRIVNDSDYIIEAKDKAFVVWYQYSYNGKRAIAKYVIQN